LAASLATSHGIAVFLDTLVGSSGVVYTIFFCDFFDGTRLEAFLANGVWLSSKQIWRKVRQFKLKSLGIICW